MSFFSRVSWTDGMLLLPQHFQQAERNLEATLGLHFRDSSPTGWGFFELQLNDMAVTQGRLELERCRAIFPDGAVVDVPEVSPPPAGRRFTLEPDAELLEVFLVIPVHRSKTPLASPDTDRADRRYVMRMQDVPDNYEPTRTQGIEVLDYNLRFAYSGESLDGLVSLKIAEIEHGPGGTPQLRSSYIPPCLMLKSSSRLEQRCRDLVGAIGARARSLAETRYHPNNKELIQLVPSDLLSFLFLQTLNAHLPVLRNLLGQPSTHPARFFEQALQLAGSLATFEPRKELDLPVYRHEDPGHCFAALDARLKELLSQLFRSKYEVIPLRKKDGFWIGFVTDEALRARGQFLLAVTAEMSTAEIMARFANACKIAEIDEIEQLVRTHIGGVRIAHIPNPPPSLPASPEACFFQIVAEGPGWGRIRETGKLAFYIPTWLKGVGIELIGVRT